MVCWIMNAHCTLNVNTEHEFLRLLVCINHRCSGICKLRFVFDLDKFRKLPDENDEVKLALEAVGSAVDIEALQGLSASINEVVNYFHFDLEFVLKNRPEESQRDETLLMRIKAHQFIHSLLHYVECVK